MSHINQGPVESESLRGCIKVISFDAEGTLVTPDFTHTFWHEAIPAFYAQKNGIELTEAKRVVAVEYDKIGDQKIEWYDINYWFGYLHLGTPEAVIKSCQDKLRYYPEVVEILSLLGSQYKLIVASGTPLELLQHLLQDIETYFTYVFSSSSHYKQLKTPDFYLQVCREMNVEPNEVVHVGDNWQFDFLNPKQIGINAFYLDRTGNNHRESLADLTQLKPRLPV
jgi:putative hydrolase of the HAD superfamily